MVVIYHRNTPLPKVRKGLDGYTWLLLNIDDNSSMDNFATLMSCTQPLLLTNSAQLKPPPWPLINNGAASICS
jgi:hypothetical protein